MNDADEWLMLQVTKGDVGSLERLIRRHADSLLTFLTRLMGSSHQAEDVFQDVFMAVWTKRMTFRYPMLFRPWLLKIAQNKCLEHRRRRVPIFIGSGEGEMDAVAQGRFRDRGGPIEQAVEHETETLVLAAIAELPEKQRAALVMHLWNGLSFAEIAEALGIRQATVRSNLHYALQAVRRRLESRLRT